MLGKRKFYAKFCLTFLFFCMAFISGCGTDTEDAGAVSENEAEGQTQTEESSIMADSESESASTAILSQALYYYVDADGNETLYRTDTYNAEGILTEKLIDQGARSAAGGRPIYDYYTRTTTYTEDGNILRYEQDGYITDDEDIIYYAGDHSLFAYQQYEYEYDDERRPVSVTCCYADINTEEYLFFSVEVSYDASGFTDTIEAYLPAGTFEDGDSEMFIDLSADESCSFSSFTYQYIIYDEDTGDASEYSAALEYVYDAAGRVTSVTSSVENTYGGLETSILEYVFGAFADTRDLIFGNLVYMIQNKYDKVVYEYDDQGNTTHILGYLDGDEIYEYTYEEVYEYAYDDECRIIEKIISVPGDDDQEIIRYEYQD